MAAPSVQHEARVATLDALARLSGFSEPLPLQRHLLGIPDVARFHPRSRAIFIGDGKATESPGNSATSQRLWRYSKFLVDWHHQTGAAVIFALAFSRPNDAMGWWAKARSLPFAGLSARTTLHTLDQDERVLSFLVRRAVPGAGRNAPTVRALPVLLARRG